MTASRDNREAAATDRAGVEYWSGRWTAGELPTAIDPRDPSRWNYVNRCLHAYFQSLFGTNAGRDEKLLEIGCGNSVWLPYFQREHGFAIEGLDYSPEGCDGGRRILAREQVRGEIHCANLFSPPAELERAFDAVVSFGVVEHFDDTDATVRAAAEFVAPGGVLFTLVPNMNGLPGLIQKTINRQLYDAHVPLTPSRLAEAHTRAGLTVLESRYFLSVNFGINSLFGAEGGRSSMTAFAAILYLLNQFATLVWKLEELMGVRFPEGRLLSPYVITTARRLDGAAIGNPGEPKAMGRA